MTKELVHVLAAAGMTEREAGLYLAGLRMGSAPASAYARSTALNRVTTYNALELLVQRGACTVERTPRGRRYAPVAPEFLAVEARKSAQALDRALPELRSLRGAEYRQPVVRFYEGWEGVRQVYEDTLTATTDLLNFANSAVVRRFWPHYDGEYVAERVKRGVRLRGIAPDDAWGRKVHGEDRRRLREIRLVPAKDFDFTNEINIYDNKVAICSLSPFSMEEGKGEGKEGLFGVIIESKEVAETQRQIFAMAWRYAGKGLG